MNESVQRLLEELLEPLIERLGFELWGVEYLQHGKQALVRLFIDREGGVTVDDCALVSDQAGALLDVENPVDLAYRFEVSSPGLDRVLFKPAQYRRYIGERLKLRLNWVVDGHRNIRGLLSDCDEQTVKVALDTGEMVVVPFNAIHRARLVYQMAPEKPKRQQ